MVMENLLYCIRRKLQFLGSNYAVKGENVLEKKNAVLR